MRLGLLWYIIMLPRYVCVYTWIIRARVRIWLGFRRAMRRLDDANALQDMVGAVFKEASPGFSGIHRGLTNKPGFDVNQNYQGERTICWEAPIALLVYLEDRPALALGVELRGKTICIRQLQGAPGLQLPKPLRKWPRYMVAACIEVAIERKLSEVRVYNADLNLSYHYPVLPDRNNTPEGKREHRKRMRRRYEGTARQMGLKKKKTYWVWENPEARP